MAADLTSFDKALRTEMGALLEDQFGKPYPGPGKWTDLTPEQVRENADWDRRATEARDFVSEGVENVIAEAKERFGLDVYDEDGSWYVSGSAPHSRTYVPDDKPAYDQWRRDHPGDWGRLLFALEKM